MTCLKLSIIIPTYNEETNIETCLNAIFRQNYPRELLEIIIVDNRSMDHTIDIIARKIREHKFDIKLYFNDLAKDAEVSKMIGLKNCNGDLFLYLDADVEIVGSEWINQLIRPFHENPDLMGSFPRFIPKPDDVPLGRYLRYHPLELDPIFQFFCTEINQTIIEKNETYNLCQFFPPMIPPIGICIYNRNILLNIIGVYEKFMDIDVPVILSKKGYNKFAYVPNCGIYHVNVKKISDILNRRARNIHNIYLPNLNQRQFRYFNLGTRKDQFKLLIWVIYANLFLPKLIKGLLLTIRNRDLAGMYEPILSIILTDAYIYHFLKDKNCIKLFQKN